MTAIGALTSQVDCFDLRVDGRLALSSSNEPGSTHCGDITVSIVTFVTSFSFGLSSLLPLRPGVGSGAATKVGKCLIKLSK